MSSGAYGTRRLRNVPVANVVPSSLARRIASQAATRAVRRSNLMMARRPMAGPSYSRSLRAGELKFFDTVQSGSLIDATGEIVTTGGQLNLIPQGDTESTRDGRECVIKSIQARWSLSYVPAAAATASGTTFIMLVLDTMCTGAAAAATDVMTSATFSTAMFNLGSGRRFRIIKRWVHNWGPQAGATTAYNNQNKTIDFYKKCNLPLVFNSTAGALTEIRGNNLFLLAGCTAGIDDLVTLNGQVRLRFQG